MSGELRISDLIKMLQEAQQEHGDLVVSIFDEYKPEGGYLQLGGVVAKKLKKKTVLEIY
jgi:hypothetical protein